MKAFNTLKDASGNEWVLGGSRRVSADGTNSTANTLATAVSTPTLPVGTYDVTIQGAYAANVNVPGFRTGLAFSGTLTALDFSQQVHISSSGVRNDAFTALNTVIGGATPSGTGTLGFIMWGSMVVSVAGALSFQYAPSTANAMTIKRGTTIKWLVSS